MKHPNNPFYEEDVAAQKRLKHIRQIRNSIIAVGIITILIYSSQWVLATLEKL